MLDLIKLVSLDVYCNIERILLVITENKYIINNNKEKLNNLNESNTNDGFNSLLLTDNKDIKGIVNDLQEHKLDRELDREFNFMNSNEFLRYLFILLTYLLT